MDTIEHETLNPDEDDKQVYADGMAWLISAARGTRRLVGCVWHGPREDRG
jgi:hypothetical protein